MGIASELILVIKEKESLINVGNDLNINKVTCTSYHYENLGPYNTK